MPSTPRGIVYPDSTAHTRMWDHLHDLASSVDAALLADSGWIAVALNAGWTPQAGEQAPQIKKLGNMVRGRGNIVRAAGAAATPFTFPVGMRPAARVYATNRYWTGAAVAAGTWWIGADGSLNPEQVVNASTYSLDNIIFDIV